MTQEEKYLQWMEEYFSEDDRNNLKAELIIASDNGKLLTIWSSIIYGRIGMYVRNYMRNAHPEIDSEFEYGKFEDYSWELIQKLVEKWKANKQSVEVQNVDIKYSQEDKELLLKDLCGRLPYGVKVEITHWRNRDKGIMDSKILRFPLNINKASVLIKPTSDVRPYLFPLSSMTEEQKEELFFGYIHNDVDIDDFIDYFLAGELWCDICVSMDMLPELINWLLKNHFDIHGLIPKGLALDATGLNIY